MISSCFRRLGCVIRDWRYKPISGAHAIAVMPCDIPFRGSDFGELGDLSIGDVRGVQGLLTVTNDIRSPSWLCAAALQTNDSSNEERRIMVK
jgi:hypothetical protein